MNFVVSRFLKLAKAYLKKALRIGSRLELQQQKLYLKLLQWVMPPDLLSFLGVALPHSEEEGTTGVLQAVGSNLSTTASAPSEPPSGAGEGAEEDKEGPCPRTPLLPCRQTCFRYVSSLESFKCKTSSPSRTAQALP